MKHRYLTILVVVLTMVSVSIMLSENVSRSSGGEERPFVTNSEGERKNEENNAAGDKLKNEKVQVPENKKETVKQDMNKGEEPGKGKKETGSGSTTETKAAGDSQKSGFKTGKTQKASYPTSAAVFKIEPKKLQEEISLLDKAKLLSVVTKISPVDYAKINNYLRDDNYPRGIINVFSLLKMRLSRSDYEQLKSMASKYVDVECIESYIN